jgi:hypothetical protein
MKKLLISLLVLNSLYVLPGLAMGGFPTRLAKWQDIATWIAFGKKLNEYCHKKSNCKEKQAAVRKLITDLCIIDPNIQTKWNSYSKDLQETIINSVSLAPEYIQKFVEAFPRYKLPHEFKRMFDLLMPKMKQYFVNNALNKYLAEKQYELLAEYALATQFGEIEPIIAFIDFMDAQVKKGS